MDDRYRPFFDGGTQGTRTSAASPQMMSINVSPHELETPRQLCSDRRHRDRCPLKLPRKKMSQNP